MKLLRRIYYMLLYALPAVLFFSYYPVIRLGSSDSMNFELSLPLIWLVAFDVIAFVSLLVVPGNTFRHFSKPSREEQAATTERAPREDGRANGAKKSRQKVLLGISNKKFFLFSLFPFYATISILWSANSTRAFLTAGITWLLFFAVFAIIYITPLLNPVKSLQANLLKTFFISSAIICIVCWLQAILDVLGVGRETTLLCQGCVSQVFGFPHPSGFAIEPQFMGNLLLAPTLLSFWMLMRQHQRETTLFSRGSGVTTRKSGATLQRQASRTRLEKIGVVSLALLYSATLFLTFSRGAIYAFAAGLAVLLIFALIKHQFRPSLLAVPVVAFIFTLTMQGIFNVVGPTHGSFVSGVAKSVHQLSLGIIDFRPQTPSQDNSDTASENTSTFDGYIAESTDIRLNLNSAALKTWSTTPKNALFGVGLGGAGTALYENRAVTKVTSPKEIVQNQPLSLLLELGLVGVALVVFSLLLAFCPQIFPRKFVDGRSANAQPAPTFWQHPALPLLLALIIAYVITLQFFSGLPNALHIYLLPPLLYYLFLPNQPESVKITKNSTSSLPKSQK